MSGSAVSIQESTGGARLSARLIPALAQQLSVTRTERPGPDAESVLSVANAPDFGLVASISGGDKDPVLRAAIVDGLKTGMVAVNDFGTTYAVQLPFGGVGGSGYGRFGPISSSTLAVGYGLSHGVV